MRIAFFTDGIFPYVPGGMQKHSYFVAKYLAQEGVEMDLYHFSMPGRDDAESLDVFSPGEKKFIHSILLPFPKFSRLPGHYLRESREYSRRIFEIFRNRPAVDFVYAKGFAAWQLLKERENGYSSPPVGIKFHGMNMFLPAPDLRTRLQNFMMRPAVNFNLRNAEFVFSYGGKVSDAIENSGISRKKILEIPTGVSGDWIADKPFPAGKPIRFVFAGRFDRVKGIRELGSALNFISGKFPFEFTFIGPFPEDKRLNLPEVRYTGEIRNPSEMKNRLEQADVLVLTSYSEGMPNAILEGMACGLAIFSTDVGAVSTVVSEKNGWLISSCDEKLIQQGLEKIAMTPLPEIESKKSASISTIRGKFSWNLIAGQLRSAIESAINMSKSQAS